jgi:hypothetical protein
MHGRGRVLGYGNEREMSPGVRHGMRIFLDGLTWPISVCSLEKAPY